MRRWIDQDALPVTADSPARIPGEALAQHAVAPRRPRHPLRAMCSPAPANRFTGLVTRVQIDGIMAQVDIQAGPHRFVSLLSAEAVRELDLQPGSLAVAVIKATTVIVETPR